MARNTTHPDYDKATPAWARARDVLAGEDAVKAAGEKYLPRMDSQSEEEYDDYRMRASFFGATARTREEYLDLVFRRAPVIGFGERTVLEAFGGDCDLCGVDFLGYGRQVVSEVLSVGRSGSLVLWDEAGKRPCVSLWRTEDIINWTVERTGLAATLVEVVLRDSGRLRVLRLVESKCVQEFWKQSGDDWLLEESVTVLRDGVPVPFIPFVFHGPRNSRPEPDRLPLADVIAANLDHYRLDADYKHGLHFAALPTAWVSGFEKGATLRIGSSKAWVSDIEGAKAGFLEFSGAGLEQIQHAMERVERRMTLLGAQMLEMSGPDGEATLGERGDLSGLGNIIASLNRSLTCVLQLACWWIEGGQAEVPGVAFTMNTDLNARAMRGEDINALVAAWRAGAISRDTMLERLKRGEVLPDGRTVAEERALIHGKARAEA